jgi:hypothetical protein
MVSSVIMWNKLRYVALCMIVLLAACATPNAVVVDVGSTAKEQFRMRLPDHEVRDAQGNLTVKARNIIRNMAIDARAHGENLDVIVPHSVCGRMQRNYEIERMLSGVEKNIFSTCGYADDWVFFSDSKEHSVASGNYH